MKHQTMTVPPSSYQRGRNFKDFITVLALAATLGGGPLIAQDGPPLPPAPGGGDTKPRELTPEELEAQRKAQEAWYASNLERFRPHLIKTVDQLAGVSPVEGKFLSLDALLWKRLEGGKSMDERQRDSAAAEDKILAESRAAGIPPFTRTANGRGTAFRGLDQSGRPIFRVSASLNSAKTIQTDKVWPFGSLGLDLTGTNRTIGMWDLEHPYVFHPAFGTGIYGRLTIIDTYSSPTFPTVDHATRVAGVLGGAQGPGNPGSNAKGMAYGAVIHAFNEKDEFEELQIAYTNIGNMRITSHTYHRNVGWDIQAINHLPA